MALRSWADLGRSDNSYEETVENLYDTSYGSCSDGDSILGKSDSEYSDSEYSDGEFDELLFVLEQERRECVIL